MDTEMICFRVIDKPFCFGEILLKEAYIRTTSEISGAEGVRLDRLVGLAGCETRLTFAWPVFYSDRVA
jgi:hypothetical protein